MISALNKYSKVSYETPVWNTQSSNQQQQINTKFKQTKRNSQMSILDKIRASKNIDLEDIDISHKITKTSLINSGYDDKKIGNFYNNSRVMEKQNIGSQSTIYMNKADQQKKSSTILKTQKKKDIIIYTPARQKIINPLHSKTQNVTPQKSSRKLINQSSRISRPPLVQLSVHQQLYLDSRKKQIKRSTELMIQNQYFKKKHPFKPQIGKVSEFLAQERYQKIKERQKFEKQFQQFDQWRQDQKMSRSIAKSTKKLTQNTQDLKNQKQSQQKQAELKNYTMLRQFFYYLADQQESLCFINLSSKKLCQLPAPMIKLLQPIIETFYKNKTKHTLTWLQFLSEFNLKVNKRKAFFSLIEKWFNVKFGVSFEGSVMHQQYSQKHSINKNTQESTNMGHSIHNDENSKLLQSSKKKR